MPAMGQAAPKPAAPGNVRRRGRRPVLHTHSQAATLLSVGLRTGRCDRFSANKGLEKLLKGLGGPVSATTARCYFPCWPTIRICVASGWAASPHAGRAPHGLLSPATGSMPGDRDLLRRRTGKFSNPARAELGELLLATPYPSHEHSHERRPPTLP